MTNLIPPKAKRTIKREYWVRTFSVAAILTGLVAVVVALTAAPIYAMLSFQLDGLRLERGQGDEGTTTEYENAVTEIKAANTAANQLITSKNDVLSSVVLGEISAMLTSDITLTGFSYAAQEGVINVVTVRGVATTRASLVAFKDALERKPLFARADVPVSSLAESTNISFELTVSLAKNE